MRVEREKALAAAETIEQFIKEIERQVREHDPGHVRRSRASRVGRREARLPRTLGSALAEQRELDFLRLLRNVPAVTELRHIDVSGKEQLRVSRLALDAIGSRADFSDSPAYKARDRVRRTSARCTSATSPSPS